MAKLTADDILAMAAEANLESPRVILRKLNSGRVAFVLYYGPADSRQELVVDRSLSVEDTKEVVFLIGDQWRAGQLVQPT